MATGAAAGANSSNSKGARLGGAGREDFVELVIEPIKSRRLSEVVASYGTQIAAAT